MGVIGLDLQDHLTILTKNSEKMPSMSLLYTDLGRPRSVTRPNVFLPLIVPNRRSPLEHLQIVLAPSATNREHWTLTLTLGLLPDM